MKYTEFLKSKVIVSEDFGFEPQECNRFLKPHQKDVVQWALKGGRRAIFKLFGLGKTLTQLEIARQCILKENKPFLIVCPLGVIGEFRNDAKKFEIGYKITYITDTDTIEDYEPQIFITNYERVRMGDIDPSKFCGVSFDEASILRNLKTETTNYVINYFGKIPYRFVATATPTPNDYIEILNYAVFLNIASRGHLLTRFFQRDSTHAGHLTLYPNKEKEFWQWVSTWAVFVTKPSDLGHDDTGYDLPELKLHEYCVKKEQKESYVNKFGKQVLFEDTHRDLISIAREKRETIDIRSSMAIRLVQELKSKQVVIFCHLNPEQDALEKALKEIGITYSSIRGGESENAKETKLNLWRNKETQILLTKDTMYGSGVNLQQASEMIFVGLNHKFNNFIQGIHRIYRFGQTEKCNIRLIFTDNEYPILKVLYKKWENHKKLQVEMISLVKEYGLNTEIIKKQMERQIFKDGHKAIIGNATLYNNDTVIVHQDPTEMPDNSIDSYLTSIPFGDHYEYSDNYNDMGHNHGNVNFFKQLDFLTPEMLRCLKPGRVAAIHVKDRIRYSYQNGTCFTTISDFSGQCVEHYTKHGFHLMGKITVVTDVVRENNQTYRLGWTEQTKDATKMGVGMPEYILLFRKVPTDFKNAYADMPVVKAKSKSEKISEDQEVYTRAQWQLDAHAFQRSNGDRFLTNEELEKYDLKAICDAWMKHNKENIYSYREHLETCEYLEDLGKLSSEFMTLPVHSNTDWVWTDINRMRTLNANQVSGKKEKHICPLQFDIIERLITRYSNKGELVCDPFGGLFSTAYKALEMGRRCVSIELNSEYYKDGLFYVNSMNHKITTPTLFDFV